MQPPLCLGHSHSASLQLAAQAEAYPLEVLNFWQLPFDVEEIQGVKRLSAGLRARLRAPLFSLIGGQVHQDIGMLEHERPFDLILPEAPHWPLQPGAEIIPAATLQAELRHRMRPYLELMADARSAISGPMYQLQSPPISTLDEVPAEDPGFTAMFGHNRKISSPWLRRKLFALHSALVEEACKRLGIIFVPCPPESMDAEGFLLPGLNGTPGHASPAYGALQLRQIRAILAQPA